MGKKKEKKEKEIKTPLNRKAYIHHQPSTVFTTIAGYLSSLSLSFLFCKIGIVIIPASQDCCELYMAIAKKKFAFIIT